MAHAFTLEIYLDGRLVERRPLPATGLSVGRDAACDLVLPHRNVSKQHARLSLRAGQPWVEDTGSTSGTFVDGKSVTELALAAGGELTIGPYRVKLLAGTAGGAPSGRIAAPAAADPADALRELTRGLLDLTRVVGVTDLEAMLDTLLAHTMRLVGAARGFVVLIEGDELSPILAAQGTPADERFSRTTCQRAREAGRPLMLSGREVSGIESLASARATLVVALPLIHAGQVRGLMYMESERVSTAILKLEPQLLEQVGELGGRALAAALERRQVVSDQERWRWLASYAVDEVDVFRTSRSPAMREVLHTIQRTAEEDVTALLLGESGTGKEMTARAIHRLSDRRDGPFVAINCGALPHDLVEAELFGHEKGAFTGAVARKAGRLELARGGTLLLDEIGDLPRDVQVKLLRVLEGRTFERVGGSETLKLDARVLAATNRDLADACARGEFREDLYYRLNVITIQLPPLRERPEDVEPLVHEMLLVANRRFKRKLYGVTPEALSALIAYRWPGNVRELRNVIERAFILERSDRITAESLPVPAAPARPLAPGQDPLAAAQADPLALTLEEYLLRQERDYVRLMLDRVGGNVAAAARLLGLNRTAFHRRLRRLGL